MLGGLGVAGSMRVGIPDASWEVCDGFYVCWDVGGEGPGARV